MNRSIQNVVIGNLAPMGANPSNAPSRSSVNRDNLSAGLEVANPQKRKLSQKSAMVILDNGDETDPKTPKKGKAKGNAKGNSMEKKMEFQNNMLNTFRLTQEANTAHATSRNDIAQKNFAFKEKSYNNQLKIQDNKQKLSKWKATKRFDLEEKKMVQKKQEMDMRLLTKMSSDAYTSSFMKKLEIDTVPYRTHTSFCHLLACVRARKLKQETLLFMTRE